ncbi:unnamed protein product, partial [Prunus brigantina]
LNDPHILKTLTLNIKTSGYNVLPGTQPLALVYRIYYKVTGTNMNFQALNKSPKDQTLLIQSCTPDANIRIPHTVKWSEITLPTDWTLVTESQPMPIQRSLNNLDYIRQYMDGSVKINFQHQPKSTVQLQQLPTPSPSKRHEPARHSSASSSTTVRDLELEKDLIDLKIASLKKKDQVSHPCYNQSGDPYLPKPEPKPVSPPTSPTQSDFIASELAAAHVYDIDNRLNVLKRSEPFKINWKALEKHLLDPVNTSRRDIYHKIIPDRNKRNEIHQAWKDYMRSAKVEINYLDFVESRYISNELKTFTKEKWVKLDKSEVVLSHPPVETILITAGTKTITAAPFKIPDPTHELNKCLVEQNNYTNQSLVVVGKQLDKIETKIDKLLPSAPKLKSVNKPLVQFQDLQPKFALKTSSTTKKIEEMLEQLSPLKGEKSGIKVLGSSSFAIANSVSDSEPNSETNESSNISKIESAFNNLELESELNVKRLTNKINPTSLTKNWYPKPTPPDIQFEERNNLSQFSVSSDKLYEWNIDGLSEHKIMNKLTHMSMVANSYITNHSLRQSEIVPLLETGFTGTLRSWWDKHLTDESRNNIIHAVKLNEDEKDNLIKVLELRNSESSENETMVTNSESVNNESSDSHLKVKSKRIESQLSNPTLQKDISNFEQKIISEVCSDLPTAFWYRKNHVIVKQIKSHVKTLPCLGIPTIDSFKIVETDASDIGYGGILKQITESIPSEQIVRFHSGVWTQSQSNYTMATNKDKKKMSQDRFPPLPRILPATLSQNPVKIEPSSSPVKHEPFTLTPYPGHPPIPVMSNRFSPLGTTVAPLRPNYQSALVSSYDPFQLPPTATPMSSQFFPKSSPYVLKNTANLFILEPHIHKSMSPAQIAEHHFPPNFHYLPHSPYKSLKFYREILHETKSVEIKPIRDKTDPTKIIYHSLYIHKVLSQKDWGLRPHELRTLPSKYQYNYADYVESWYYIFLHQTPEFSHSWFINFDVKFRNDLPYWFLHWWDTHGPKSGILPPSVNELITYWTQKTKFAERDLWFSRDLLFITKYRIPWIMRWNYAANWETRFFSRQFFVKWWDRFEVHRITEYVYRDLPPTPKPAPPQMHESTSAHSSETTLTVDGKSKAELQDLAQQILLRASQMQDDKDADTESQSSSSCQTGQQSPDRPMRWSDYPHGQDPNEDYAEAYKAYDLNSD